MPVCTGMRDELAPPPWLSRMAVLGVPPRYQGLQPADSVGGDDGSAADGLLHFVEGSDDDSTGEGAGSDEEDAHTLGHTEPVQLQGNQPATDQSEPEGQSITAANGARASGSDKQVGLILIPGINCPDTCRR